MKRSHRPVVLPTTIRLPAAGLWYSPIPALIEIVVLLVLVVFESPPRQRPSLISNAPAIA